MRGARPQNASIHLLCAGYGSDVAFSMYRWWRDMSGNGFHWIQPWPQMRLGLNQLMPVIVAVFWSEIMNHIKATASRVIILIRNLMQSWFHALDIKTAAVVSLDLNRTATWTEIYLSTHSYTHTHTVSCFSGSILLKAVSTATGELS